MVDKTKNGEPITKAQKRFVYSLIFMVAVPIVFAVVIYGLGLYFALGAT